MNEEKPAKRNLDAFSLFVAALLVGGVGFYTDNNGFVFAGGIFLLVAIGLVIGRKR